MASKPQSISVKDLSTHIDRALENARRKPRSFRRSSVIGTSSSTTPGSSGSSFATWTSRKAASASCRVLAKDVATELQAGPGMAEAAAGGRAQPALLIHGGHVTMGYFPHDVFSGLRE